MKTNLDKLLQDAREVFPECPDFGECVKSTDCTLYQDWNNCGFYKWQLAHNPQKGDELMRRYIDATRAEVCISREPSKCGNVYCRDTIEIHNGIICHYRSLFEDKEKGLPRCTLETKKVGIFEKNVKTIK